MPERAWLTPALPPVGFHWQAVLVPDAFLLYTALYDIIIRGALLSLTEIENWEQVDPAHQTIEETTAIFQGVFDSFIKGYPVQPTATIQAYASGPLAPDGWLMCDGALVLQADYPLLYGVIGDLYGSAPSGYFALPDLRGRLIVGVGQGAGLSDRQLTDSGGAEEHTLTVDEIPSHAHAVNGLSLGTAQAGAGVVPYIFDPVGSTVSGSMGGGQAHNNMPPFLALNFIIFTGTYPYAT